MQLKWTMLWDLFSLFPAYAGVIPQRPTADRFVVSFPRIRGGDPEILEFPIGIQPFSPHTRG